jgi:hypothetical protein
LSFEEYCNKDDCQAIKIGYFSLQEKQTRDLNHIKKMRSISMDRFDILDLDRPIVRDGKTCGYEKVCRVCGAPLLNKNGNHSYSRRYCREHDGRALFEKYNWPIISKKYAEKIRDKNAKHIVKTIIDKLSRFCENKCIILKNTKSSEYCSESCFKSDYWLQRFLINLTICEKCHEICLISSSTLFNIKLKIPSINIHHKIPVHTLTWKNITLIWDEINLISLCPKCHNGQDHLLSKPKPETTNPFLNFKKITEFL